MLESDRNDLKRRAPATALGPVTARFGDWARSFPGYDRMCQLVPSRQGRARIAGRAMAQATAAARKTLPSSKPGPKGKNKDSI